MACPTGIRTGSIVNGIQAGCPGFHLVHTLLVAAGLSAIHVFGRSPEVSAGPWQRLFVPSLSLGTAVLAGLYALLRTVLLAPITIAFAQPGSIADGLGLRAIVLWSIANLRQAPGPRLGCLYQLAICLLLGSATAILAFFMMLPGPWLFQPGVATGAILVLFTNLTLALSLGSFPTYLYACHLYGQLAHRTDISYIAPDCGPSITIQATQRGIHMTG